MKRRQPFPCLGVSGSRLDERCKLPPLVKPVPLLLGEPGSQRLDSWCDHAIGRQVPCGIPELREIARGQSQAQSGSTNRGVIRPTWPITVEPGGCLVKSSCEDCVVCAP